MVCRGMTTVSSRRAVVFRHAVVLAHCGLREDALAPGRVLVMASIGTMVCRGKTTLISRRAVVFRLAVVLADCGLREDALAPGRVLVSAFQKVPVERIHRLRRRTLVEPAVM